MRMMDIVQTPLKFCSPSVFNWPADIASACNRITGVRHQDQEDTKNDSVHFANYSGGVRQSSTSNQRAFGNYAIAGGLANQGSVYVDGAPVNSVEAHVTSLIPAQDSVQEFRVESSVVNPQYDEFSGGIVSFVTKSGGNALHGTTYDYLRNTIFNANNFFLSGVNQPRPKQLQNQFGATVGGPIKHDQAFFYASYEGIRSALGVPNLRTSPHRGGVER